MSGFKEGLPEKLQHGIQLNIFVTGVTNNKPIFWAALGQRCTVSLAVASSLTLEYEKTVQSYPVRSTKPTTFRSSNICLMFCSKSVSTMNTSLTMERFSINSLESHLIRAGVLKELNGFSL